MEPSHNNYQSPTELPNPEANPQHVSEQSLAARPEVQGSQQSTPGVGGQQPLQVPVSVPSINPPAISSIVDSTQPAAQSTAALIADDADLIEKEWVARAKAIVLQTKDDPYQQNTEMNKVKADYLKKRYNKDLKVSEN